MKPKLKFYEVNAEYIAHLSKVDSRVPRIDYSATSSHNRFLCGIIFGVNGCSYFAPVSSFHTPQRSNFIIRDSKGNPVSSLRFSYMIPIPLEMVSLKDVQNEEARYRNLLNLELRYINQNINAILTRAKYVYESVVIHKDEILMNTCCDFKKLEVACVEFIKSHGLQTEQIETDAASVSAAIERNEQERNKRAHPHTKPPRNSHNER